MRTNSLFISYGHGDMAPTNWLERLRPYLAPLRRGGLVDVWDDTRIAPGTIWRDEILQALDAATASILLVGPSFLASDFVVSHELPNLLDAARTRGAAIYPVVVGYCSYRRSALEPYQAFNDPDRPLEALAPPEQNKILNDVSLAVDDDLRHAAMRAEATPARPRDVREALRRIGDELDNTLTAFRAQCRRRDLLVEAMRRRLGISERMQFENFFFRYHRHLDEEERFQFDQIRAITEGPLHDGNREILRIVDSDSRVLDEVPSLADLKQHIVFWLNKYERVFARRPEMCLLYVGVEDGVEFPKHAASDVDAWLRAHE